MKATFFGFFMAMGWYSAKILMRFVDEAVDHAINKRNSQRIIRRKYVK